MMNEFYLERANDSERQVKYARVGYVKELQDLARKLTLCKAEETDDIIKEINAAKRAMEALEATYRYNVEAYRGEGGSR